MPGRLIPLVTGEIYHFFNQGIDRRPAFTDRKEYSRVLQTLIYYRFSSPPVKLSQFLLLSNENRVNMMNKLNTRKQYLIRVLSFCFMPNHFHLLTIQDKDNGISKFMSNFQNSYTRYFNTKHERIGPLFLDQFKAVRIETDEQLLHVSRYIHLNPFSSFIVKQIDDLESYKWSSFSEYLSSSNEGICEKNNILALLKNKEEYKKFVFDQANYQRELEKIKHLLIER